MSQRTAESERLLQCTFPTRNADSDVLHTISSFVLLVLLSLVCSYVSTRKEQYQWTGLTTLQKDELIKAHVLGIYDHCHRMPNDNWDAAGRARLSSSMIKVIALTLTLPLMICQRWGHNVVSTCHVNGARTLPYCGGLVASHVVQ